MDIENRMGEADRSEIRDALFQQYYKTRTLDLRNRLVEEYLFIVDLLVRKYLNKGVEYDDLYQIGSMALVLAVERFDPTKGYSFSAFATPTVIGEIKRYFRDKAWSMKVPRKLKEITLELPTAREALQTELGRPPRIPELAEYMGYSEEAILEAMESGVNYKSYSLNQAYEESGDDGENPSLERYTGISEEGYESFENAEVVKKVVRELSDKERTIFDKWLLNGETQQKIAADLNVSQMTVSRIENEIRNKFREEYFR
jgi:RNA polymerase sigma-B factor